MVCPDNHKIQSRDNLICLNLNPFLGWDFVGETINGPNDFWAICELTNYPKLVWQIPVADFICPDGVDFLDYSFFANHFGLTDCNDINDCNSTDLDFSGSVDINDVNIFTSYWLFGKQ